MVVAGVLAVLSLALAEAGLRLAGYGHDRSVLTVHRRDNQAWHVPNIDFFDQFFNHRFLIGGSLRDCVEAWDTWAFAVPTRGDSTAVRIVILGGSAALSDSPDVAFGPFRILEVLLEEEFPDLEFEFLNLACNALNSHVMREVARQVCRIGPDLMVVYMGNNEYVGPWGAAWAESPPRVWQVRTWFMLGNLRLFQWLQEARQSKAPLHPANVASLAQGLLRKPGKEAALARMHDSFRRNLDAICAYALGSGAHVIACTVGSSHRDWPPTPSLQPAYADLSEQNSAHRRRARDQAIDMQREGKFSQALRLFRQAIQIHSRDPDLLFRYATCCWQCGLFEEAQKYFREALERDLPVRCNSRANRIIREVATASDRDRVLLADAEKAFAAKAPRGVPGREFFCDNVHLTFEGSYVLACSVFERAAEAIASRCPGEARKRRAPVSLVECAQRLGLGKTLACQHQLAYYMDRLTVSQVLGLDVEMDSFWKQLEDCGGQTGEEAAKEIANSYLEALSLDENDYYVRERCVRSLDESGDLELARTHARELVRRFPGRPGAVLRLARIEAACGQTREAIGLLENLAEAAPEAFRAYSHLGLLWEETGDAEKALVMYEKALEVNGEDIGAHYGRARIAEIKGDAATASSPW